ncbi:MAG: hypothetical protein ACRC9V_08000, partial [Aeromonas sp.]
KCQLGLNEAQYMGFRVGRGLIQPQEKKLEAIKKAPQPRNKTQVRAFFGLVGYYRCFIPNFSSVASLLTDLTKKGQPEKVVWTPEADKSFHTLQRALLSSTILHSPD